MSSSLVSVVLPVHNGAAYLHEAISSVLAQTFKNFELIVIDDCSTDESTTIVNSFKDTRVRLIIPGERLRICNALNLGIENAKGQFFARMDADDICSPLRLERQVRFLQRHPEIGFCGSWVRRFGTTQQPQTYRRPVGAMRVRAFALFDNPMVHSSVMLRRDVLRRIGVGYRDDFANAEDYDLWSRLFEISLGDNLPEILMDYRVHTQSVTNQKTAEMDCTACRVLMRELKRLGLEPTDGEVMQHRLWATGRLNLDDISRDIDSAEQWLVRLLEANRMSCAFNPAAFLWATREIWFALCYRVQAFERPILRKFFQSPISRGDLKGWTILLGAKAKHLL